MSPTRDESRRARILVVEDESVVAWDIQRSLEDTFDVVGVAATADEAFQCVADSSPDLVLMDIRIQGARDGVATAAELREKHDVPIVYLTAHGDSETLDRVRNSEPYGYLLKPFKRPELLSAVRIALLRHQMEQKLRAREHFLSTTLHSIGEAVVLTDHRGCVTSMNEAAEKLTGWTAQSANGRAITEIVVLRDERTKQAIEAPTKRAIAERTSIHAVGALLIARNGTELPIVETAAPIIDDRRVYGAVTVLRDMTETRRMQRRLEFTDRLASLGTMAAGVAHEVNNPLAFIVTNLEYATRELDVFIDALADGKAGTQHVEALREVLASLRESKEGTDRVARIVSDLRQFSREDPSGSGDVIDVRTTLEWALNVTAHAWKHQAKVTRKLDAVPLVRADERRLGQVFVNLLLNAAQALEGTDKPEKTIDVSTSTSAAGEAVIEIKDNGPGMPDDVKARAFEPFFTTKPFGKGTGLGLSICHGIVTALGGTIEIVSEMGRGTSFIVRLRRGAHGESSRPAAQPASARSMKAATPRRSRVLVIDDDKFVRLAIERTLQVRHEVRAAASMAEALAYVETEPFDVVLCDLMMPGGSGVDFYRALADKHPELLARLAFLTGGAFAPDIVEFLASTTCPTLEKPFDSETLLALIDTLTKRGA